MQPIIAQSPLMPESLPRDVGPNNQWWDGKLPPKGTHKKREKRRRVKGEEKKNFGKGERKIEKKGT